MTKKIWQNENLKCKATLKGSDAKCCCQINGLHSHNLANCIHITLQISFELLKLKTLKYCWEQLKSLKQRGTITLIDKTRKSENSILLAPITEMYTYFSLTLGGRGRDHMHISLIKILKMLWYSCKAWRPYLWWYRSQQQCELDVFHLLIYFFWRLALRQIKHSLISWSCDD